MCIVNCGHFRAVAQQFRSGQQPDIPVPCGDRVVVGSPNDFQALLSFFLIKRIAPGHRHHKDGQIRLRGAYGLGDSDWYLHGKYSRLDISGLSGADFDLWEVGVGYSYPINQASDVVFDAAYQQMRFDGDSLDGYRVGAGVRTILGTPRLEGHAKAHFYTGGDSQSQWAANVGLNFFFTQSKRFSVIGEYEFADSGDDIFWIGLRASF